MLFFTSKIKYFDLKCAQFEQGHNCFVRLKTRIISGTEQAEQELAGRSLSEKPPWYLLTFF